VSQASVDGKSNFRQPIAALRPYLRSYSCPLNTTCHPFLHFSPDFTDMSDDEVDHELLELLRQSLLGPTPKTDQIGSDTKVLRHAEFIYDNSIDVNIDARGTRAAAQLIWDQMQARSYSTETWSEHDLHPKAKDEATLNFIFVMDLLNFSFWSEKSEDQRYAVEYRGKRWTGYWSLVACLQRALEEGKSCLYPSFSLSFTILSCFQSIPHSFLYRSHTRCRYSNHNAFLLCQ
jgi:hypothetical protein